MEYTVGIIGSTGAVGKEIIKQLSELKFPVKKLVLFATQRSAGIEQDTQFGKVTIEEFSLDKCDICDIIFLAVSGQFALQYARLIVDKGIIVIDNSSAYRYDDDVPLIIPQINGHALQDHKLIANPNCTTAIAAMSLGPINTKYRIKKIIISTYQAASGAGQNGMDELESQLVSYYNHEELKPKVFQYQLLHNVIPHIDVFMKNGYTKEEMKVNWELTKILGNNDMAISCTSCRVPALRSHSESIVVETELPIDPEEVKTLMQESIGVELRDDIDNNIYPMPITSMGKYDVQVGRIRQNIVFGKNGLEYFTSGDQLLRGAALNSVEIAQLRLKIKEF